MKKVKINNEQVKILKAPSEDIKNIKGYKIVPKLNCNIFIVGRKECGKSSVIYTLINKFCGKNTFVHGFVGTHQNDEKYKAIKEYLDKKGIQYIFYDSITDGKKNHLNDLLEELRKHNEDEEKKQIKDMNKQEEEEEDDDDPYSPYTVLHNKETDDGISFKVKKELKTPKHLFLFDDMSDELKNPKVAVLLKEHRHYNSKCIISSQYPLDIITSSRKQIDLWILFGGMDYDKLEKLYENGSFAITFEEFLKVYYDSTKEKHNFLYIFNGIHYRHNFNTKYEL